MEAEETRCLVLHEQWPLLWERSVTPELQTRSSSIALISQIIMRSIPIIMSFTTVALGARPLLNEPDTGYAPASLNRGAKLTHPVSIMPSPYSQTEVYQIFLAFSTCPTSTGLRDISSTPRRTASSAMSGGSGRTGTIWKRFIV
jgi:hypothetical protein